LNDVPISRRLACSQIVNAATSTLCGKHPVETPGLHFYYAPRGRSPLAASLATWRPAAILTSGLKQPDLRRGGAVLLGLAALVHLVAVEGFSGRSAGNEQPARETFESAEASWRFSSADVQYRIEAHRRVLGQGRSGSNCESIAVTAAHGSYLYITHPIANCRVVSELAVSLWLKANRPDLQILARVVLPNTRNPETGKPFFALVRGSSYKQVGTWQELRVANFPQLVERQVRVLRAQHGSQIDSRGAYVDLTVINIYGGEGPTQVWIDDLEATGVVLADGNLQLASAASSDTGVATMASPAHSVRLSGTILSVDGRPIFPRIVEHQGEPLAQLAEMGFNGIRVSEPPSATLLAEAERAGMWIVAPPPSLSSGLNSNGRSATEPMPAMYDRVLAWSLGQGLTARDYDQIVDVARRLRVADRSRSRPLLCAPETDLLRYSRELRDLLSVYRFPLSTSLQLTDYGNWLRERQRLARPGTPFWTVIQTQPAASMRAQWAAFGQSLSQRNVAGGLDSDALRLLAFTAVGAGVRGLEFASHSPLDASDNETRMRALTLSILNAELDLAEPWAAAGNYLTTADSNDPHVKAVLLQYESSRLLLVTRAGPDAQYVPLHGATPASRPGQDSVSFVVPGVPESHDLIELTAGGLRPLKHKRVTGGTLITLDDFDTSAYVLMTPDPLVINVLSRRLAEVASRNALRQRELVTRTLAQVEAVERRLPGEVRDEGFSQALNAAARRSLDEADAALRAGNQRAAFVAARRANVPLGQLQRKHWERARASVAGATVASPLAGSFGTLPDHWQLMAALPASVEQPNRLPAGDFEELQSMLQVGWRQFLHSIDGIETSVEVSPGGTAKGRSCLRIEVRPKDPASAATLVETAPVWVTSPPVQVRRGEIVRVRGKVRVATPIRGSVDGLLIVDSFGGEALAERFGTTKDWEEFLLYRAAPSDGEMTVTFALTGFGEAMIDDVEIQAMLLSGSRAPLSSR
jgi:hypothetical protein